MLIAVAILAGLIIYAVTSNPVTPVPDSSIQPASAFSPLLTNNPAGPSVPNPVTYVTQKSEPAQIKPVPAVRVIVEQSEAAQTKPVIVQQSEAAQTKPVIVQQSVAAQTNPVIVQQSVAAQTKPPVLPPVIVTPPRQNITITATPVFSIPNKVNNPVTSSVRRVAAQPAPNPASVVGVNYRERSKV